MKYLMLFTSLILTSCATTSYHEYSDFWNTGYKERSIIENEYIIEYYTTPYTSREQAKILVQKRAKEICLRYETITLTTSTISTKNVKYYSDRISGIIGIIHIRCKEAK